MLASQDRELVPQHQEFHVLSELGPPIPNEQPQNAREGEVSEGEEHLPILPGQQTSHVPPPHGYGGSRERGSAVSGNRARVNPKKGETRPNKQRGREQPESSCTTTRGAKTSVRTWNRSFDTLQATPATDSSVRCTRFSREGLLSERPAEPSTTQYVVGSVLG